MVASLDDTLPKPLTDRPASASCATGCFQWVDPLHTRSWDSLCLAHAGATVFHTRPWLEALVETYGFRPTGLVQETKGRVAALWPFLEVKKGWQSRKAVALPFTDVCEPLLTEEADKAQLWREIRARAETLRWSSVELRGGLQVVGCSQASLLFRGHLLDLTAGEDRLYARLDSSVRRAIRKAQRHGLTVDISAEGAAVEEYYKLHCVTRKRHGLPPQPFSFFRGLQRRLMTSGGGWVVTARQGQTAVAAAIYLEFNRRAVFKFGASGRAGQALRANDLVMWEAIKWLARRECLTLDFGRTSMRQEGLRRFKRGWGAEEHQIEYGRYDLRRSVWAVDQDRAHGWYTKLFRVLPVWLGRAAGAVLYRRMA
jgi:hypothetical protein